MHRFAVLSIGAVFSMTSATIAGPLLDAAESLGITAENCSVSGLDSTSVTNLLDAFEAAGDARASLASGQESLNALTLAVSDAASALADDPDNVSLQVQYSTVVQAQAEAQQFLETARNTLWDLTLAPLSSVQRATLSAVRSNLTRTVPAPYRVLERSPAEWEKIERALRLSSSTVDRSAELLIAFQRLGITAAETDSQQLQDLLVELSGNDQVAQATAAGAENAASIASVFAARIAR